MDWISWVLLIIILCYSSYPGKVRHLESVVRKLEKKQKGENGMSKLISDLHGQQVVIKTDDALQLVGKTELLCHVLDSDDEWLKVQFVDKKSQQITKLLRIENIDEVEITKAGGI